MWFKIVRVFILEYRKYIIKKSMEGKKLELGNLIGRKTNSYIEKKAEFKEKCLALCLNYVIDMTRNNSI